MTLIPLPFLFFSIYTDFKYKKIKNYITYPLILLGLVMNSLQYGLTGLISSFLGLIMAFFIVILLPGFKHGAGDTKLAMGIGSFIGSAHVLYFLFFWFLFSLLVCNIKLLKDKGFGFLKNTIVTELITPYRVNNEGLSNTIGAPTILLGYLLTLVFIRF